MHIRTERPSMQLERQMPLTRGHIGGQYPSSLSTTSIDHWYLVGSASRPPVPGCLCCSSVNRPCVAASSTCQ